MTIQQTIATPERVKLRIEDFEMLDRAGAFAGYRKTELIDGVVIALNAQYRPHAFAKNRLARRIADALTAMGRSEEVITEASVAIPPFDEPEPDIIVTNASLDAGAIPVDTVLMLVEVADSTAAMDLGSKAERYASAGVPEYWVLELPERLMHQFSEPGSEGYRTAYRTGLGRDVTSATIAGLTVSTEDLV